MRFLIRAAEPRDLDEVFRVESACFPPAEGASYESLRDRLDAFRHSFFVAETNNKIVGLIDGCVTDLRLLEDQLYESTALHREDAPNVMIFGLAVDPDYQKHGIASRLMTTLIEESRCRGKKLISLTCKEHMIPFYERFGYVNEGVSDSAHGGVTWYNMTLFL